MSQTSPLLHTRGFPAGISEGGGESNAVSHRMSEKSERVVPVCSMVTQSVCIVCTANVDNQRTLLALCTGKLTLQQQSMLAYQKEGMLLWVASQVVVDGSVPHSLHLIPVGDCAFRHGVLCRVRWSRQIKLCGGGAWREKRRELKLAPQVAHPFSPACESLYCTSSPMKKSMSPM